jgi:hypothetical protein
LLAGLAWSLAYDLVAHIDPNSFAFNLSSKGTQSIHGFT